MIKRNLDNLLIDRSMTDKALEDENASWDEKEVLKLIKDLEDHSEGDSSSSGMWSDGGFKSSPVVKKDISVGKQFDPLHELS